MTEDIKIYLKKMTDTGQEIYGKICTVTAVNTDISTIDVMPIDGTAPILDVYLQGDVKDDGILETPKKDALVCVVFLDKETAVMVRSSVLESYQLKIDKTVLKIDENGYSISKDGKSLKDVLDGLIEVIMKIVVVQGKGPDIAKLKEIDGDIKTLLI